MSQHFERQIDKVKTMILSLGSMVEQAVDNALRALEDRDIELAHRVIDGDTQIDLAEIDVEEECMHTLALYQPVASDLRFVVAVLTINKDLERIGDLAVNLAEQSLFLAEESPAADIPFDLIGEGRRVRAMLKQALDALVNRDAELARQVLAGDDEIDSIHRDVYQHIKRAIAAHPEQASRLIDFLNASRHLERIADHAVNVAEDVIYLTEGRIVRHLHDEHGSRATS